MNQTSIIPNHVSENALFDKDTGWRIDIPPCIEPGTRVLCLYRVSTDKQLYQTDNNEADIPMQRKRCRKYCESMGWTIVCELQEEGVSGHKVRAENRDKIQLIKEYAKQKKFDILLVFMFDRIGRISDETPLAGNVFCGHCGARLCITTSGKGRRREDGTDEVRTRYTCQTKSRTHGDCDGQTGYTVHKLDAMIDSVIHTIFAKVSSLSREEIIAERFASDCTARKAALESTKREYEKAETELKNLKKEIIKSISGESAFSPELLNSVIQEQEAKCGELKRAIEIVEQELDDNKFTLDRMSRQYDDILEWSAAYDHVTFPAKKVIVSHIIERVDVYRGYQLNIKLNLSVEQFLSGLDCTPSADMTYLTSA